MAVRPLFFVCRTKIVRRSITGHGFTVARQGFTPDSHAFDKGIEPSQSRPCSVKREAGKAEVSPITSNPAQ